MNWTKVRFFEFFIFKYPDPTTRGSKIKKWQIEAKPAWHLFGREKSIGSDQKTVLQGELLIWRTKNETRDQGIVQLKDSICFKSVQIGYYEIGPWIQLKWA
jgi:hypothetical protein